jgi:DNA-binding MarR family transcriptional regulator
MKPDDNLVSHIIDALDMAVKAHRLLPVLPPEIKAMHFRVLLALYHIRDAAGQSRVSDLNSRLGMLLPNTTRFVNELVDSGVLEKCPSPTDRRVVLVRATDLGETYIHTHIITYHSALQAAFIDLDETDCLVMIGTMEKVYKAMQKVYRENGKPEGITQE